MREIKFRYWNGVTNMMVNDPKMPYKEGWTITDLFSDRGWVWLQYTGLKDKNGKEIYESDILNWNNTKNTPVTWMYETGCWDTKHNPLGMAAKMGEVIGNIYENSEMLGESGGGQAD